MGFLGSFPFVGRTLAISLVCLSVASTAVQAQLAQQVTYRWEMVATEGQVNNYMGSPDGSTDSVATADVLIKYNASTGLLHYEMTWRDLEWPLSKIHLHGPAGPSQSVMPHLWNVFTEEVDVLASGVDRRNDTWTDTVPLTDIVPGPPYLVTPGILQAMVDELGYMNFHTLGFPMGEVRANLVLVEENVPVTRAHRKCLDRMQRVRERGVRAWQRLGRKCFAGRGPGETFTDCLDAGSPETDALADKIEEAHQTSCWGFDRDGYLRFPAFGGGRQEAIAAASRTRTAGVVENLFGSDPSISGDKKVAACQSAVLQAVNACSYVVQREFRRCTRPGFRGTRGPAGADLPFDGPEDMALCLGEDSSGRIARACDRVGGGGDLIRRNLEARCTQKGVDPATAFPGCPSGDEQSCALAAARCRACQTVHATTDDSALFCETFDDGFDNGSCGS